MDPVVLAQWIKDEIGEDRFFDLTALDLANALVDEFVLRRRHAQVAGR